MDSQLNLPNPGPPGSRTTVSADYPQSCSPPDWRSALLWQSESERIPRLIEFLGSVERARREYF